MELLRLVLFQHPAYLDQYIKPLKSSINRNTLDDILDRHEFSGVSAASLSRISSNLVTPTGRAIRSHIDRGWGTERFSFCAVVSVGASRYSKELMYLSGYMDHSDVTHRRDGTVALDPNMRMYFNGITDIMVNNMEYRNESIWQPSLKQHDQILHQSVFDRNTSKDTATMRPADLFRRKGERDGQTRIGSGGAYTSNMRNLVGSFTTKLVANNRENNNPTSYLARAVGAYAKASANCRDLSGEYDSATYEELLDGATDRVSDNVIAANAFFDEIRRKTNVLQDGFITFGDLQDIFPDFNENTQCEVKLLDKTQVRGGRSRRDNADSLKGDTVEVVAINILKQSLPALLLHNHYSGVEGMVIRSHVGYGDEKVIIPYITPYIEGSPIRATYDTFVDSIETILLPEISKNGRFKVDAKVNIDVEGEFECWISIDDQPEVYANHATFADGRVSSTLTDDLEDVADMSADVLLLSEELYNKINRDTPNHFNKEPDMTRRSTTRSDMSTTRQRPTRPTKLDF